MTNLLRAITFGPISDFTSMSNLFNRLTVLEKNFTCTSHSTQIISATFVKPNSGSIIMCSSTVINANTMHEMGSGHNRMALLHLDKTIKLFLFFWHSARDDFGAALNMVEVWTLPPLPHYSSWLFVFCNVRSLFFFLYLPQKHDVCVCVSVASQTHPSTCRSVLKNRAVPDEQRCRATGSLNCPWFSFV